MAPCKVTFRYPRYRRQPSLDILSFDNHIMPAVTCYCTEVQGMIYVNFVGAKNQMLGEQRRNTPFEHICFTGKCMQISTAQIGEPCMVLIAVLNHRFGTPEQNRLRMI